LPRLKRTAPRATSGATPIASNVALGSVLVLEHAAPLATANPALSSSITSVSPSTPGNAK